MDYNTQAIDFNTIESQDAVRFSWNTLPPSRLTLTNCHIPLGCIYTPMKDIEDLLLVQYPPQSCSKCQSILNPYCKIDLKSKSWLCPFCLQHNNFPQEYANQITEHNIPAEIVQQHATMEYLCEDPSLQNLPASIFMFLIDTCVHISELQIIKDAILQAVDLLPPSTWVGLASFGKLAFIHQLSAIGGPVSYTFNGEKDYTTTQVLELLGITNKDDPDAIKKFIVPISKCEKMFKSVIEALQPDPWMTPQPDPFWTIPPGQTPLRCTGTAVSISVSLLETAYPGQGSRLFSFIGGPCTYGPGQIVSDMKELDLLRINADKGNGLDKYSKKAIEYYQGIAERATRTGLAIDIFSFIWECGLTEMRSLSEKTGGILLYGVGALFECHVFRDTLKKIFEKDPNGDLRFGFCGEITINLSQELRISGAIGPCKSLKKQTSLQASTQIGETGTSQWYIGGMDKNSTVAFYLDLPNDFKVIDSEEKSGYIQFLTKYRHPDGSYRLRVTTVAKKFAIESSQLNSELAQGFDQEAACLLMARLAVLKSESEPKIEVVRWIDRSLVKLAKRFAECKHDDATSFRLPKEFMMFPEFMFRLRIKRELDIREFFWDEYAYFRAALCRENTDNCMLMILPSMLMYSFDSVEPAPVRLDISSMQDNVILLVDRYFTVFIWKGEKIYKWEKAGYQDLPEYTHFKKLLQDPCDDVKLIMEDRYPVPRFRIVYPGITLERLVKREVNPALGFSLDDAARQSGDFINETSFLTEFLSNLVEMVVSDSRFKEI